MSHISFSMILLASFALACSPKKLPDCQAHRGSRGLYPENTLDAFQKSVELLGLKTLELDVVLTKDKEVLISHEPWFSPEICLDPQGQELPDSSRISLYALGYAEIQAWDCGSKGNARFPEQQAAPATKPLLKELFARMQSLGHNNIHYNIELKFSEEGVNSWHPPLDEAVAAVLATLKEANMEHACNLQAFDRAVLREIRKQAPSMPLAYLLESYRGLDKELEELGFVPEILSPYYKTVNAQMLADCRAQGMALIPWTVNEVEDMRRLMKLGVDALITDYPNRFTALVQGKN